MITTQHWLLLEVTFHEITFPEGIARTSGKINAYKSLQMIFINSI